MPDLPGGDSNAFEAYLEEAAPETIETAWRAVLGDEALPDDVKQIACETLVFNGAQGVAGLFVMFDVHPYWVIADALAQLDRDDPRKAVFVNAAEVACASDEPTFEFAGRVTGSLQEMLLWQERFIRRHYRDRGRRPAPRARSRPRQRRTRSSNGRRGPPDDDRPRPDDPDDIDLKASR